MSDPYCTPDARGRIRCKVCREHRAECDRIKAEALREAAAEIDNYRAAGRYASHEESCAEDIAAMLRDRADALDPPGETTDR